MNKKAAVAKVIKDAEIILTPKKRKAKRATAKAKKAARKAAILRRKKRMRRNRYVPPSIANTRVILYIPFNNLNVRSSLPKYIYDANLPEENTHLTEAWINKRINIFMNFTLKSLVNQTNQNFIAYVVYHDSSRPYINQALLGYAPLPYNVQFISVSEYEQAVKSKLVGYKYWYELHLYSDDMYSKYYIDMLYNYKPRPKTQVLICQNGYIYRSQTNQIAKYFNYSSSFNCLIYRVEDYMKGVRHNLWKKNKGRVWEGAILLPHEIINYPAYLNHSHGSNSAFFFEEELKKAVVTDVWVNNQGQTALFGEIIVDEMEKQRILDEFLGPRDELALASASAAVAFT